MLPRNKSEVIRRRGTIIPGGSPLKNLSTAHVASKINKNTEELLAGREKSISAVEFGIGDFSQKSSNRFSSRFSKNKLPIPGIVHNLHCSNPSHPEYNSKFQHLEVGIGKRMSIFKEIDFARSKMKGHK